MTETRATDMATIGDGFKITAPGFYRNRGGDKVEAVAKRNDFWIIVHENMGLGGNPYMVEDDGLYGHLPGFPSRADVVAIWEGA